MTGTIGYQGHKRRAGKSLGLMPVVFVQHKGQNLQTILRKG
jgi:hypothetical protein